MLQEEQIVQRLSAALVAAFPAAMDSPLVGAGVWGTKAQQFYSTGRNLMKLLPAQGHEIVHAEEQALEAYIKSTITTPEEALSVVSTLEPCKKRDPKEKVACAKRIFEFSQQHQVERVVIGIIETGKGLGELLEKGVSITLLHGPEHDRYIEEKLLADQEFKDPRQKVASLRAKYPFTLRVIASASLDSINREELTRSLRAIRERDKQLQEVISFLQSSVGEEALFSRALRRFPTLLREEDQDDFVEILAQTKENPAEEIENLFSRFFARRVYNAWRKLRAQKIERELRERESHDAEG